MNKIIEMRKSIQSFLKSKHPRVFFEAAPDTAVYPYLVYDLPNSFNADESTETFVLEIDGWDYPSDGDTTALETLMDLIDKGNEDDGLHRKVILIPGMSMVFYRENRLSLKDDDIRIRRRKYVYQIKTFAGG